MIEIYESFDISFIKRFILNDFCEKIKSCLNFKGFR